MTTRRALIASGAGLVLGACHSTPAIARPRAAERFAAIEQRLGGRVGVCAIDTGNDARIGYRQLERFAMASTFKWVLAAAILQRSQGDEMPLDSTMYYTVSDILPNSPTTEAAIDPTRQMGALTLEQLCEAAVTVSDNCAANLLLVPMFGPEGLTNFLRANGDPATRLDRPEMDLNENRPGDPRDTTLPWNMARTLQRFLTTDETLNALSREKLIGWMVNERRSLDRLRAGLPPGWRAGAKPGTGGNGAYNDCAIVFPPGRAPIVIASYMSESDAPNDRKAAAHAEIAGIVADTFA